MGAPTLLILGAGSNVGAHVARAFAAKGYQIALASRTKSDKPLVEGQIHFTSDLSNPDTLAETFAQVRKSLGIPSVVVYNAAAYASNDKNDPAAFPHAEMSKHLTINTVSVLAAAHEAVKGFRELPADVSKSFIYTGNRLNIEPIPSMLSLGVGKAATANLIAAAATGYEPEGFKFFYADERTTEGAPVYGAINGEAHGKFYWQLANRETVAPWLATFVKGIGYKQFH